MHAGANEADATVCLTVSACDARAAVEIRFDRTPVSLSQTLDIGPNLHHFHAQFMAQNARIRKERLPSSERVQIGATDANLTDSNTYLSSVWWPWVWRFYGEEFTRPVKDDLFHGLPLLQLIVDDVKSVALDVV